MNKLLIKYSLVILTLFLISFAGYSQENMEFNSAVFPNDPSALKEAQKSIAKGNEFYKLQFPLKALQQYLKAEEFNSFNASLSFKIAHCYLDLANYDKLLMYFKKAYKLNPEVDPEIHYYLGIAYHLNAQWDDAITEFEKQKKMTSKEDWDKKIEHIAKKIDECNYGKLLAANPLEVKIQNLGELVNSPYPDYSPIITADETEMYFTSRRNTTTGGGQSELDNQFYEDIYYTFKENGKWAKAENVGSPLNTNTNDATIALMVDGQRMIIYKDDNGGDIYETVLSGNQWSKPVPFPKSINTSYQESFASFSPDGNTIYFVSDKPTGSFGGKDIYTSKRLIGGGWSTPVNLGPKINTRYDEAGVFMHPDGKTLYFSSKGHNTIGGFDIFKSVFNSENNTWSEPENIGYPINTPGDDLFMALSANGKRLYYSSSNKDGFGEKDIYVITMPEAGSDVIIATDEQLISSLSMINKEKRTEASINSGNTEVTIFKGRIMDGETNLPMEADIEIADNELRKVIAHMKSNSKTGRFLVALPSGKNYGVAIKVDGYLFHSENFDIAQGTKYQEISKEIKVQKVKEGATIVLNNIFFDFDKADLRSISYIEIDNLAQILKQYPTMRVELSGHTDNLGSEEYNKKLSERRAKAVYDVLIKDKKIAASRLVFVGYGKSKPVAPNAKPDGTDDPDGRQLNRRTEFKIITM